MVDELIEAMAQAIEELKRWPDKGVQLFHHNDADGLSSGAILTKAFEREGFEVNRFCLEKPYPAVLKRVYEDHEKILIFADFAGRIAPMLSELNDGRNLTLVLDHHPAQASTDPRVHNLNPDFYGLRGDRDISASTTCYLFAKTLNQDNRDMAHIAALGAVGDKFFVQGCLVSQNREVAMEAVEQGMLEIKEQESGEVYLLKTPRGQARCDELGDYIEILGGAGYYQDGPAMGIEVCLEGDSRASDRMVENLKAIQTRAFESEISRLRGGALRESLHIQWFHVEDRFSPMGVKIIGLFCETISEEKFLNPDKYIAGFQNIPNQIPGFGPITFNEAKISMRVSPSMEDKIRAGKITGLNDLLPEATNRLGGFSDACHSLTAATTIANGKEESLIREMENILGG